MVQDELRKSDPISQKKRWCNAVSYNFCFMLWLWSREDHVFGENKRYWKCPDFFILYQPKHGWKLEREVSFQLSSGITLNCEKQPCSLA